jgi:hypothetical protein
MEMVAKSGGAAASFHATGSQVEVLVSCTGLTADSSVVATVLQSTGKFSSAVACDL